MRSGSHFVVSTHTWQFNSWGLNSGFKRPWVSLFWTIKLGDSKRVVFLKLTPIAAHNSGGDDVIAGHDALLTYFRDINGLR